MIINDCLNDSFGSFRESAGYQDKERKKNPEVNVLLCAWSLGHEGKKVAIDAVSHFFFFGHESRSIGIGGRSGLWAKHHMVTIEVPGGA